jgi:hypothetical protein
MTALSKRRPTRLIAHAAMTTPRDCAQTHWPQRSP